MNLKNLTAGQLMSTRPITIGADETLRSAALLLHRHHIHCLLVLALSKGAASEDGSAATKSIVRPMLPSATFIR